MALQALRCTLQQLVCTGPLPSLHYLLVGPDSTTEAVDDAAPWPRLLHLACENSAVTRMDASMALLPAVQILNLSRACIDEVEYAERCVRLDCLNLSFNRFRSVRSLPTRLGAVKRLVLRGNELESTVGLERLYALEGIDLASNLIIGARPPPLLRNTSMEVSRSSPHTSSLTHARRPLDDGSRSNGGSGAISKPPVFDGAVAGGQPHHVRPQLSTADPLVLSTAA